MAIGLQYDGEVAGFWPDIDKSRAEAKRLLKEAGAENLEFELLNRDVDQPYKYVGIWIVDEWSKIGVKVTQKVLPSGPWVAAERAGDFSVVLQANCHSVVNPLLDVQPYLSSSVSKQNYGNYEDPREQELYEKALHETDPAKQRELSAGIADLIERSTGLSRAERVYTGWVGVMCPSVSAAISMMRLLSTINVLSRREDTILYVPVNPIADPKGEIVTHAVAEIHSLTRLS